MKFFLRYFTASGIRVDPSAEWISPVTEYPPVPFRWRHNVYVSGLSVITAALAAITAWGLLQLIRLITGLAFYGQINNSAVSPSGHDLEWLVIVVPVAGALLVSGYFLISRHRKKAFLLNPLAGAIAIGTGTSAGAEGPAFTGGISWGSIIARLLHLTPADQRILQAAGAAGGIACLFGTPVAAVILILELSWLATTWATLLPLLLGSAAGGILHYLLAGSLPVLTFPDITWPALSVLPAYFIIGLITGMLAALLKRTVSGITWLFGKLPLRKEWWPVVAAVLMGLTGYYSPETLGAGEDYLNNLLLGQVTLQMLFALGIMKFIAWSLAYGSGIPGGTITPLFIIGGACGLFIALVLQLSFPAWAISVPLAVLTGMAAMYAGAAGVLVTALVFALEISRSPAAVLPLVLACLAAYAMAWLLRKRKKEREYLQQYNTLLTDQF